MKRFLFSTLFLLTVVSMGAQSLSYVKDLIEQGRYIDAAKRLRPLADGGNADAQVMAAQLFFEGKGVSKNDAQGVKYATLAANQGNEEAVKLLANHYWLTNPKKAYETLKYYIDHHPYLKKKGVGLMLAECYYRPVGTQKNEELGWAIAEANEQWETYLKNNEVATHYYDYQIRKVGKDNIEDYADYLFGQRQKVKFKEICDYIKQQHPDIMNYYLQRGTEGNGLALAMLADYYYDRDLRSQARDCLKKSLAVGSAYGRSLVQKVEYEPVTYNHLECYWVNATNYMDLYLLKIEHKYNKTIFYFNFKAKNDGAWIRFDKGFYALCDDNKRKYMMTSPTTRKTNTKNNMRTGNDNYFTLEFEGMPTNWSKMALGLDGELYVTDIRHETEVGSKNKQNYEYEIIDVE